MKDNNKLDRDTWSKIIQVVITVLTVISGMLLESSCGAIGSARAMLNI